MAGSKTPDAQFSPLSEVPRDTQLQSFDPAGVSTESASAVDAPESCITPGTIVGARYRVQSLVGHGGMGKVYKVEQIYLGRELALKVLNTRSASDVTVRRFQHEARAAFGIDHPNLIAVHDFGLLDDKIPFLVMDYVKGKSLADRIRETGTLSVAQAVPIFLRICFGLGYAHERGVIHRDIKPSNIMLVENLQPEEEGSVKIVDFGIAKFTQFERGDIQALTRTGEVFGSPLYMSPEQCSGSPVDQRSDIYSLGCVFFEALTGTTPFVGANALSTMMQHMGETTPTMKEASMGKTFPPLLEQIIAKMLAKKPSERYQSLNQVTGDLAALERSLGDPQLLATTVLMETAKSPSGSTMCGVRPAVVAASHAYLVMALLVILSATLSAVITSQLCSQSPDRAPVVKQEKKKYKIDEQEMKVIHREAAKQFLRFLEIKNGRVAVSDKSVAERLRYPNQTGKLDLKYVHISDTSIHSIAQTKWIENIDLLGSSFNNSQLIELASLPRLFQISLSMSNLDDVGARGLSHCPNLSDLTVSWSGVTDKSIAYFTAMKKLRKLEISGIETSSLSMKLLAEMKNLQQLIMVHAPGVKDEFFAPMVNSHLNFLNIEGVRVGDRAAFYISRIEGLLCVSIGNTDITAAGVEQLLKNKTLSVIMYVPCKAFSQADAARLSNKYPNRTFTNQLQKGDEVPIKWVEHLNLIQL